MANDKSTKPVTTTTVTTTKLRENSVKRPEQPKSQPKQGK